MRTVRFLYFDIGYTLIDETAVWDHRCRKQANTAEAKARGLTAKRIWDEIVLASRNYLPQYRTVAKKFGFQEVAPYRAELEVLYPQAKPVLKQLASRYRLGVIANQTDGLDARLRAFGIRDCFTEVISSWDYGIMKPDPELFRIGIEKAGCPAQEIAMIGDRLDNDIFPAKTLGMQTVWIKQGFGGMQEPRSDAYVPTETVATLDELTTLFL